MITVLCPLSLLVTEIMLSEQHDEDQGTTADGEGRERAIPEKRSPRNRHTHGR